MSGESYKEMITKTFCDSAIRSVMMIDDDFLPYDALVKSIVDGKALTKKQEAGTTKAANIHQYFQMKKVACDVDNGTDNLDVDRIRKCDLVILDYHLEFEDPARSLNLIRALRDNPHMNLLVVYTSEDLSKTWNQICASLRGNRTVDVLFEGNDAARKIWDELTESGAEVPDSLLDEIDSGELKHFMLFGEVSAALRKRFGADYKQNASIIATAVCEEVLRKQNVIGAVRDKQGIVGRSDGSVKWLQSGNVFVALHGKTSSGNDAPGIWDTLNKAVEEWSPTYYQLLISEVQNWMENEPLSFSEIGLNDIPGQAAWLSSILRESCAIKRGVMIDNLIERVTEEIKGKLLSSAAIKAFVLDTLARLSKESQEKELVDLERYAASHLKINVEDDDQAILRLKQEMFHSLNANLCSRSFTGDHVTNGSVLYNEATRKFYLCVSPACDAVPEQHTSPLASRLAPHRFMKLLALENCGIESALAEAVFGRHIFVSVGTVRKALVVQNSNSHNPSIDYVLVHNHSSRDKNIAAVGVDVSFLGLNEEGKFVPVPANLKPVAQLRDSYTARYQTVASHHSGRVGVDYINFPAEIQAAAE